MIIYTQMPPKATGFMLLLGVPFFAATILAGLAWDHKLPGIYFAAIFSPFAWSYAYSKALVRFVSERPDRPIWPFLAGVATIETIVVVVLLSVAAA